MPVLEILPLKPGMCVYVLLPVTDSLSVLHIYSYSSCVCFTVYFVIVTGYWFCLIKAYWNGLLCLTNTSVIYLRDRKQWQPFWSDDGSETSDEGLGLISYLYVHFEVSHQMDVHNLVVISHWNGFSPWPQLVSDNLTQTVLIIGKCQVQVIYISFIMLGKKLTLNISLIVCILNVWS